jgi:transcription elongation factor Elf1
MSDRYRRDDLRDGGAAIPLTRICPECQEEMELITADDGGEVLVYECPECGSQEEMRIETESDEEDGAGLAAGPDAWLDDELEGDAEPDQDTLEDSE